jgi:16S rRNA processing protein RimM
LQLVVGRVGRPHGVAGEVVVEVHTDDVDRRFAEGAELATDPESAGPIRVESCRWHHGRLLLRIAGVADRTAAEALRGVALVADSATSAPLGDPDEFWDHDLEGLEVLDRSGRRLGTVGGVLHLPGGDLLVVPGPDGAEALVPFVKAIVPVVDRAAGRIVVDPPEGLFDAGRSATGGN